jgi:hypothetical protein
MSSMKQRGCFIPGPCLYVVVDFLGWDGVSELAGQPWAVKMRVWWSELAIYFHENIRQLFCRCMIRFYLLLNLKFIIIIFEPLAC